MCGNYSPTNAVTHKARGKGLSKKKAVDLHRSKGLCNNYLEGKWGGGGGGIGENNNKRERGLDVKFNTYRGALLFHSFLQTGKVVEELLEFKYKY